jgi:hypothetical protein
MTAITMRSWLGWTSQQWAVEFLWVLIATAGAVLVPAALAYAVSRPEARAADAPPPHLIARNSS